MDYSLQPNSVQVFKVLKTFHFLLLILLFNNYFCTVHVMIYNFIPHHRGSLF